MPYLHGEFGVAFGLRSEWMRECSHITFRRVPGEQALCDLRSAGGAVGCNKDAIGRCVRVEHVGTGKSDGNIRRVLRSIAQNRERGSAMHPTSCAICS